MIEDNFTCPICGKILPTTKLLNHKSWHLYHLSTKEDAINFGFNNLVKAYHTRRVLTEKYIN